MKHYLYTLLKLILFWMCFFFVGRLLFLLVYHAQYGGAGFAEVAACFLHALRLDLSATAYLMTLPVLLLSLQLIFHTRLIQYILDAVILCELFVCSLIQLGEIAVYGEWLGKLNYKILLYLRHPMEILTTATTGQLLLSLLGILLLCAGFFWVYRRLVLHLQIQPVRRACLWASIAFLLSGGCCVIGMRGGFDAIPITQSAAYYSTYTVLNDAAVNPQWNLMCSFYDFGDIDPMRYHFMSDEEAEELKQDCLLTSQDTLVSVLNRPEVNVVCILLESWSADLIESLRGTRGVTDEFRALESQGILFTDFYANGHRSQQAMASIFSGFPPLPMYDITDDFSKYSRLPSLAAELKKAGYHTSFYFGGNLDYGNIRSFLLHCGFERLVEEKDMDSRLPRAKLGIHDQYTFDVHHQAMNKETQPFFSVLFTLSSHSPYDQPKLKAVEPVRIRHAETPFLNSVKYCDYCLGCYFDSVRKEDWYANTLFVILGDHSHPTHLETQNLTPEYQHVPMLLYGEVIPESWRGRKISKICSHVDVASSLLRQLGRDASTFKWGKDLFNPYAPSFAYFEAYTGSGWIRPQAAYVGVEGGSGWQSTYYGDTLLHSRTENESKAYLQCLYKRYLE